jgi:xanthine dehydrogenase accessory factor
VRSGDVLIRAGELASAGEPFALATVVNVRRPASARRGDRAVVTADGAVYGWVGGSCSEPTVVREAFAALGDGESRLVSTEGSCASEGAVEILVEPQLPAPLLAIVGESPAALTLARLAAAIDWRVARGPDERADAVVVATMGRGDEDALAAALAGPAGYVGLVASRRRAEAVVASLSAAGVSEDALARLKSPAGLDLGPIRQEEVAVAILAELVAWRHARTPSEPPAAEAVDPVCGMTVSLAAAETIFHEGQMYAFCCAGCRSRFEADPARYLVVETS